MSIRRIGKRVFKVCAHYMFDEMAKEKKKGFDEKFSDDDSEVVARSASVNPQIDENALTLDIPNLDSGLNSSTKPIPFRIKVKSMNNGRSIRRVKLLSLGQIPQQNPYLSPLAQNDHQEKQQQY
ncbi:hypothetical protein AgCh_001663 [Apium graveolens]